MKKRVAISLVEMLVAIMIMGFLAMATLPLMTNQKTNMDFENNSVKCVVSELAADLNSTACQNSIKYAKYKRMNAHETLYYYADNGETAEQTAARKVLKAICDEGGESGCSYLMESCKKESDKCDIAGSDYDINHYLELLLTDSSASAVGRLIITDITKPWYELGNSNIVAAVNDACCPTINTACDIKDADSCEDGAVWCWGLNDYGQLGDTTKVDKSNPVSVVTTEVFSSLSGGYYHTCGIATDNKTWCWGWNNYGQLGDTTKVDKSNPVSVVTDKLFTSIASGSAHACGIATDNKAWCWGWNTDGQLGDTTKVDKSNPVSVVTDKLFTSISAGYSQTCATATDNKTWCWGANGDGEIGNGESGTDITSPVSVVTTETISLSKAAYFHTCGIATDNKAWCWGRNEKGEVGDGTSGFTDKLSPVSVVTTELFSSISTGTKFTCGIATDNKAWCWGDNYNGQLGDETSGSTTGVPLPVSVATTRLFDSLYTGNYHSCGIATDNKAWCWGANAGGRLGDGTETTRTTPVSVVTTKIFSTISTYGDHSCGIAP